MRPTVLLVLRAPDVFSAKLIESGFEVINLELTRTEPVTKSAEIENRLSDLNGIDGLFFTSPHAAEAFLNARKNANNEFNGNIYVLGERAKKVFENAGIAVRFQSGAATASEMLALFGEAEFAGKRFLFVRGDRSMRTIPDVLAGKAEIRELVVYRTIECRPDPETSVEIEARLSNGEIDWLCFFSPSSVESFINNFNTADLTIDIKAAAIGTTTADAVRAAGLNATFVSRRATAEDFAGGLIAHIKNIA